MIIKNEKERRLYRDNAKIHAAIFDTIRPMLVVGTTGVEVDAKVGELCKKFGVKPAFKGVYGFPSNLCISVNDCVVHGVPNATPFAAGDIVKIDFGVNGGGLNTDSAFTVQIGEPKDPEMERFLQCTKECLERGVAQVVAGARTGDVGFAVERHATAMGYHVVRDLSGHGIGRTIHERPHIYNYGKPGQGEEFLEDMVVAIEPIIGFSTGKIYQTDHFDIMMADGGPGAQFEHLMIVGKGKSEILV
jgi:methionyl aminopeptidase